MSTRWFDKVMSGGHRFGRHAPERSDGPEPHVAKDCWSPQEVTLAVAFFV